jgi:tubulin polyglutamylase TTLL4
MKPSASSCGRGIKIIGNRQDVKKKNGYIVSQYISNPLLINGFKFDLRIYALVTCFDPLKIYLFKEGLARFATKKYTNN